VTRPTIIILPLTISVPSARRRLVGEAQANAFAFRAFEKLVHQPLGGRKIARHFVRLLRSPGKARPQSGNCLDRCRPVEAEARLPARGIPRTRANGRHFRLAQESPATNSVSFASSEISKPSSPAISRAAHNRRRACEFSVRTTIHEGKARMFGAGAMPDVRLGPLCSARGRATLAGRKTTAICRRSRRDEGEIRMFGSRRSPDKIQARARRRAAGRMKSCP